MKTNGGRAAAILLAGGRGARARFSSNKAYAPIGGLPMISYCLQTLGRSRWVIQLVLVIRPQDQELARQVVRQAGVTTSWQMVNGGRSRHGSEYQGLQALSQQIAEGAIDMVAIHDGARPFLTPALLDALFRDAYRHGGAVPTLALEIPTHQMSKNQDLLAVEQTRLQRAQTPQIFSAPQLLSAYHRAQQAGFEGVDTAETAERFSDLKIKATPGDPENLKLTFPEDFQTAEILAERRRLIH